MPQELTHQMLTLQDTRPQISFIHSDAAPTSDPDESVEIDLSHEVRTSLAIVTLLSGNLDILYEQLDDARRQKMIRNIRKHAQRLNDLVVEVLGLCSSDSPLVM